MSHPFKICDELLVRLRSLHAEPNAEPRPCILPLASISWTDEWPDAVPHVKCHNDCNEFLLRLAAARSEFWRSGEIPPEYQAFWDQARELIPNWPGFQRMRITQEQQKVVEKCESEVEEFFKALSEEMDSVTVTEENGVVKWSASKELDSTPQKSRERGRQ